VQSDFCSKHRALISIEFQLHCTMVTESRWPADKFNLFNHLSFGVGVWSSICLTCAWGPISECRSVFLDFRVLARVFSLTGCPVEIKYMHIV